MIDIELCNNVIIKEFNPENVLYRGEAFIGGPAGQLLQGIIDLYDNEGYHIKNSLNYLIPTLHYQSNEFNTNKYNEFNTNKSTTNGITNEINDDLNGNINLIKNSDGSLTVSLLKNNIAAPKVATGTTEENVSTKIAANVATGSTEENNSTKIAAVIAAPKVVTTKGGSGTKVSSTNNNTISTKDSTVVLKLRYGGKFYYPNCCCNCCT
ncbi:uncharacterized protein TA04150 [Theileria annulata]|uniref:Uncharacterized protein n=1 Tax=Theileria annulata TaxID=5874 RepID=Q4UCX2_THEAN|nr:uncharacterized protein TA04150 [Theileria annulata]CAI75329.1 hypothetical protein TA04150 [Theileria annulata]|eukprot:XP_954805.1 hypothetical protein TA04150 [Theileria annulata]